MIPGKYWCPVPGMSTSVLVHIQFVILLWAFTLNDQCQTVVTGPHNEIKDLPKEIRKGSTIEDFWREVPSVESSGFFSCFGLGL